MSDAGFEPALCFAGRSFLGFRFRWGTTAATAVAVGGSASEGVSRGVSPLTAIAQNWTAAVETTIAVPARTAISSRLALILRASMTRFLPPLFAS